MAAATADLDLHFNIDDLDLDVIQAMDLDDLSVVLSSPDDDEFRFRGGACCYSAIFSDADIVVSHSSHVCDDGDDGANDDALATLAWLVGDDEDEGASSSLSSSPAESSVVTDDDGTLAPATRYAAADEATSAYLAELERFLFKEEDDDDDEQAKEVVEVGFLFGGGDDYCFARHGGGRAAVLKSALTTERTRMAPSTAFLPRERTTSSRPSSRKRARSYTTSEIL